MHPVEGLVTQSAQCLLKKGVFVMVVLEGPEVLGVAG